MSRETADAAEVSRLVDQLLATHDPVSVSAVEFRGAQFDLGLAWIDFPVGLGGLGLDSSLQRLVHSRLAQARAPLPFDDSPVSYAMAGPVIERYGTPAQKQAWLRPIFSGAQPCCQLFSEPGAGSDLAAIATRAERADDAWRVNGQKTWTTMAHQARWGLLLVRSARTANPREGMTFFLLDMTSPGITVRPLRQITGDSEYNEVFLDDVIVPDEQRLGPAGSGWQVAMATLETERRAIGAGIVASGGRAIDHAVDLWRELDAAGRLSGRVSDRAIKADALVQCWLDAEALRLMQEHAASVAGTPAAAGLAPAMKLLSTRVNQGTAAVMMELIGSEGMLYPSGYDASRTEYVNQYVNPQQFLLRSLSHSIGGGTSEIVRNVIGERVLGLPREPRPQ